MVEERYDGLSEEEKYERAVGEYAVTEEDMQIVPEEPAEFYIPDGPVCMAGGKYKKDPTIEIREERYIYAGDYERIGKQDDCGEWKIPYKIVENAIQEIKEKGPENYSSITNLLIDLAREEQKAEMERWKNERRFDIFDYKFRKEMYELYEKYGDVEDVGRVITREGSLQLEFGIYDEQELCNAFIKLLNLLKSK